MQFSPVVYKKKKKAKNNFYFTCKTLLPTFSLTKRERVNKEWDKKNHGEEKVEKKACRLSFKLKPKPWSGVAHFQCR